MTTPVAPPPFAAIDLPDWPGLDDVDLDPKRRDERRSEMVQALEPLGFSLLFEDHFTPLYSQLEVSRPKTTPSAKRAVTQLWSQVWRHPAGVIAVVERFRNGSDHAWIFNEATIIAHEDTGFGRNTALQSSGNIARATSNGLVLRKLSTTEEFPQIWSEITQAAALGRLAPLSQWRECNLESKLLSNQDWKASLPKVKDKATPSDISVMEGDIIDKAASKLGLRRLETIEAHQFPPEEKKAWRRFIGVAVIKARSKFEATNTTKPSGKLRPAPIWAVKLGGLRALRERSKAGFRKQSAYDKAALALNDLLEDFGMTPGDPLYAPERAIVEQWLDTIVDHRHPKHMQVELDQANGSSLSRFGLQFNHLLFAASFLPGAPRKAAWWQALLSQEDVQQKCQAPEADGKTLPMRWVAAWMCVPNARANPKRQSLVIARAIQSLENLNDQVPPNSWCLLTGKRSVWDGVLGVEFNASVDEDLWPHHAKALCALVQWTQSLGISLPTCLFLPGVDNPVSLANATELAAEIPRSAKLAARGSAHDRVEMLMPLVASLQGVLLQNAPSAPLASRRQARL